MIASQKGFRKKICFYFCNICYNIEKGSGAVMKLIEDLFVGGSVQDLNTVVYSLRQDIAVFHLYCICLFYDKKRNHMEIMSSREICKKRYQKKDFVVVGVAYGKAEAIDLFCYMMQQAAQKGSNLQKAEEWIR